MGQPTTTSNPVMRHVIAALVTNEPGVLAQVAGMFAARGFNIDSLVVGRTENPELSRMTIVVNGNDTVLEQVRKQLQKLVPVVKVVDYKQAAFVERDLILIQVSTTGPEPVHASTQGRSNGPTSGHNFRREVVELASLFRAKIVDISPGRVMIELSGTEDKIEAFIDLVRGYGIVELARTGVIAMPRGNSQLRSRARLATIAAGESSGIDATNLPPG